MCNKSSEVLYCFVVKSLYFAYDFFLCLLQDSNKSKSRFQSQTPQHHPEQNETIINPLSSPRNSTAILPEIIEMEDSLDTHDSHSSKHITSSPSADILSENPPSVSSSDHGSQPSSMNKNIKAETEQGMHSQATSWPLPIIADQIFNAQDFLQSQSTSQDSRQDMRQVQTSNQMLRQGMCSQDTRQSLGSPPQSTSKFKQNKQISDKCS